MVFDASSASSAPLCLIIFVSAYYQYDSNGRDALPVLPTKSLTRISRVWEPFPGSSKSKGVTGVRP